MTTFQNITQRAPRLPWHVFTGKFGNVCIEDADDYLVCVIPITVQNAEALAKKICKSINGPQLDPQEMYKDQVSREVRTGWCWRKIWESAQDRKYVHTTIESTFNQEA